MRSRMPRSIVRQDRLQHAISSLSSSSGYSTSIGSAEEVEDKRKMGIVTHAHAHAHAHATKPAGAEKDQGGPSKRKKVSSSISGGSEEGQTINTEYHDYHAQPLPDPKLHSGGSAGSVSSSNDSDNAVVGKHLCTDSSSGDEEKQHKAHRKKRPAPPTLDIMTEQAQAAALATKAPLETKESSSIPQAASVTAVTVSDPSVTCPSSNSECGNNTMKIVTVRTNLPANIARSGGISHNIGASLPPNIARSGGISHNIGNATNARLNSAPKIQLPTFLGIGKRAITLNPNVSVSGLSNSSSSGVVVRTIPPAVLTPPAGKSNSNGNGNSDTLPQPMATDAPTVSVSQAIPSSSQQVANLIGADNDAGSSQDSATPQITAFYHVNEDDMLLTDDVLMCPFIFRTQDAVLCGALAECVMPGMLRAQFSTTNKLLNLEIVYDAMGFMQQLGRASGNEGVAEIIPNSLEMSLQPNSEDARVITTAKAPFSIVSANALWTKITKFTQMEIEQKDLSILEGERTHADAKVRAGKPMHDYASVAQGRAGCSTNIYYDKFGIPFVAYVSSYPLTNSANEITHLLHVYKELPEFS